MTDQSREKYNANHHKELGVPKPVPPSIPAKKISSQSYSAVGNDTVGPALYDPKVNITRRQAPVVNIALSKSKRNTFDNLNARNMPDPAQYDSTGKVPAKQFNAAGNTGNFLSKVPNCKDLKTPN